MAVNRVKLIIVCCVVPYESCEILFQQFLWWMASCFIHLDKVRQSLVSELFLEYTSNDIIQSHIILVESVLKNALIKSVKYIYSI